MPLNASYCLLLYYLAHKFPISNAEISIQAQMVIFEASQFKSLEQIKEEKHYYLNVSTMLA